MVTGWHLEEQILSYASGRYVCIQWNLRTRDTLGLIVSSLVERLSLSMVLQQLSFVERSSLSQRVPYRRFHCMYVYIVIVCGVVCFLGCDGKGCG